MEIIRKEHPAQMHWTSFNKRMKEDVKNYKGYENWKITD